jgi:hypothetical protein
VPAAAKATATCGVEVTKKVARPVHSHSHPERAKCRELEAVAPLHSERSSDHAEHSALAWFVVSRAYSELALSAPRLKWTLETKQGVSHEFNSKALAVT